MISMQLAGVTKFLSGKLILSDISFTIKENSSVALLGPVGSGKTTVLNLLSGLLTTDNGQVTVLGRNMTETNAHVQKNLNLASSSLRLNGYASIRENLITYSHLYGVSGYENKIRSLCQIFQITHLLDNGVKIYRLSAGENTKLNLCKAFLNDPKIILLDEITAHLDENSIDVFIQYIKNFRKKRPLTILSASHQTEIVKRYCQQAIFLKRGKVIYQGKMPPKIQLKKFYV